MKNLKAKEKMVPPDENKMIKNMFKIRKKRRTLGDIERTWKPVIDQQNSSGGNRGSRGGANRSARIGRESNYGNGIHQPPPDYQLNSNINAISPK